jgi:hypothetical protein
MAKIRVRVTGRYEVGGAAPGQEVELDPDTVNVDELIRVGLVEPIDMEAPAPDLAGGQATESTKTERSGQTRPAKKAPRTDPAAGEG